jgi:hypothetical protein
MKLWNLSSNLAIYAARYNVEPLAHLALAVLMLGDTTQALADAELGLVQVETSQLNYAEEPLRVELICYQVLRAVNDPRRRGAGAHPHPAPAAECQDHRRRDAALVPRKRAVPSRDHGGVGHSPSAARRCVAAVYKQLFAATPFD